REAQEAVLWHGGEAAAARRGYAALPAERRAKLLRFLESL
ncbi:MAG: di-heme oxidoredictase family protein, partial [Betaproteobacteria bacterium]